LKRSNHLTFFQLDSLDLRQHIEWCFLESFIYFESALSKLTVDQLDATYPNLENQSGWRVLVLSEKNCEFLEIMFTWNHPQADGMSVQNLPSRLAKQSQNWRHEWQVQKLGCTHSKPSKLPAKAPPADRADYEAPTQQSLSH
jgi:hypothetical protein